MKPEDQNRIKILEQQVETLMKFMEEKKKTQIQYPLDYPSQQILQSGVPLVIGPLVPGVLGSVNGYIPMKINNKNINIAYI